MIDHIIASDLDDLETQLDRDDLRSRRVLVTGGAGFIGSWICDILVRAHASVFTVDNLSTGLMENIDHLFDAGSFKFRKTDATRPDLKQKKYELIIHLASRASPEEYQRHPIETLTANSLGTHNMLELARKSDATFLYASSSEVYGDAEEIPTPETYWGKVSPIGLRSCYDEGKRYGEALCMAYMRSYGTDVRITRLFNTFGPRIRADGAYARVVPRFISQALAGDDITVFGDGKQTRSFCYITDAILGILRIAAHSKARGEVFNVGNPQEITILDLAHKIKELAGTESKIVHKSLPPDDPRKRCPEISKAHELLGWLPKIGLETGLRKTIPWFRLKKAR